MNRSEKELFVQNFTQTVRDHSCMIVVHQARLSAGSVATLRRNARSSGVRFQVVKNNLAKRVFQDDAGEVSEWFKGPLGVFFAQDLVAASKVVGNFSKKREADFYAIGGVADGKIITRTEIERLAALPSMLELRAQLLSVLDAGSRFARVLSAYVTKQQGE